MKRAAAVAALLLVSLPVAAAKREGKPAAEPECDARCVAAKPEGDPIHRVAPKYPDAASSRGVEGCVVVSYEINPQGAADKYQVLDSQPKGVFDAATLKALNDWRFKVPVEKPGRYAQRFEYRMGDQVEKACEHCAPRERAPLPCMAQPTYEALNGIVAPKRDIRLLQGSLPALPPGSPADGGCVTVRFLLKHDGFVGDVQVLAARPAELGEPTAQAVRQWWFDSFPPPDMVVTKTLTFAAGEQVRLPDNMVRAASGAVDGNGALANASQGCDGKGTKS